MAQEGAISIGGMEDEPVSELYKKLYILCLEICIMLSSETL